MEIPRERGVSEATIFKGKYKAKMEFPREVGFQTKKTLCGWGMEIFWDNTILVTCNWLISSPDSLFRHVISKLIVSMTLGGDNIFRIL